MTYSIYHFFIDLLEKKDSFLIHDRLEEFPFDDEMLSCRCKGIFPDMAIRLNKNKTLFTGGELIELKDSESYSVSSFNSTIPSGQKEISKIIVGENSSIRTQMESKGNDISSLPLRDVYYLVRGRSKGKTKVCLTHGSFFETIKTEELISQSFSQVLEERLLESKSEISPELKQTLLNLFSEQSNFSKVRNVEKASVKLRFRIMTEVKAEGNILNSTKYPEIKDNTLNLILPLHDTNQEKDYITKINSLNKKLLDSLNSFKIKHHFNGYFSVFQTFLV